MDEKARSGMGPWKEMSSLGWMATASTLLNLEQWR
jgi:hypothetical protein